VNSQTVRGIALSLFFQAKDGGEVSSGAWR